jgi:hypothetical protein
MGKPGPQGSPGRVVTVNEFGTPQKGWGTSGITVQNN